MEATKRSRYGWMALGAFVCLGTVGLLLKMRDPNQAHAQSPEPPKITVEVPPGLPEAGAVPQPEPTPTMLPMPAALPEVTAEPPPALPTPAPSDATPPSGTPLPALKTVGYEESQPTPPPVVVPPPRAAAPPGLPGPVPVPPAASTPRIGTESSPILIPGSLPPPVEAPKPLESPKPLEMPPPITPVPDKEPATTPSTTKTVAGTADATSDAETFQPLPRLRPRPTPKPKAVLPLTGTSVTTLSGRTLTLPPSVKEQLGECETLLVSPGSSRCLWITNQAHLDRLAEKLEKSPAREEDIQVFKRLYYAQIVKLPVREGRVTLTERLAAFAGLASHAEVVLVGIDDHFELWDATTWRKFAATRLMDAAD